MIDPSHSFPVKSEDVQAYRMGKEKKSFYCVKIGEDFFSLGIELCLFKVYNVDHDFTW